MEAAIELALAHGWPDDAVDRLEHHLTDNDLDAALTLVQTQDMPEQASAQLKALVLSQWLSAMP